MTPSAGAAHRRVAQIRIALLAAAMAVVAVPIHLWAVRLDGPVPPLALTWWQVALGFVAAEVFVVHLHVKRDAHTVSLSEIPLLLGLAAASPVGLLVGRTLGTAVALLVHRRSRGIKLVFNLALTYLDTVVALALFRSLLDGHSPGSLHGLAVGTVALFVSLVVSALLVTAAIALNRTGRSFAAVARSLVSGVAISGIGAGLAVAGLALFWREPIAIVGVGILAATLYGALHVYGSLNRRFEDLEAVHEFTSAIDGAADTDEVVDATLTHVRELFDADFAEVVLSRGVGSTASTSVGALPISRRPAPPAVVAAMADGSGIAVHLLSAADPAIRDHYAGRDVTDGMVAHLEGGGGTATLIVVGNPRQGTRPEGDDLRLLDTLARQARVSFERGRLVDRLRREIGQKEHQALHDALTGLPNRLHFTIVIEDALRHAREHERRVAVLLCDLDRFKEINDTLGHQRGDAVLQEIAMRLSELVGGDELIARLGGDEFGVVLREVDSIADAAEWARRLGAALQVPFLNEGLAIQASGSIGIAMAPDHGSDGATLLRRADVAMYEAKAVGSTFEVYDPQRDGYSTRRLALAGELRDAIEAGSLAVHYQPKARVGDGTIIGVEALSRWHHPRHGIVPPDEFISLAERTGLIAPLTEHVLRTAFRDRSRLLKDGHPLSIAVNIAASSLTDPDFPDLVARLIAEFDTDPRAVTLEVTETTMMTDSARARLVLAGLDEIGVILSIDDFGTGYSSLSYLSSLPVDEVKIDRSFVMDMAVDERLVKIVTSTVSLVHSLGLRVVAEGVENRGTWDLLRAADCDIVQGFYLARPMGFTDLSAWLTAGAHPQGDAGPRLPTGLAGD